MDVKSFICMILWISSIILGVHLNRNTRVENKYMLGFLFGSLSMTLLNIALN